MTLRRPVLMTKKSRNKSEDGLRQQRKSKIKGKKKTKEETMEDKSDDDGEQGP